MQFSDIYIDPSVLRTLLICITVVFLVLFFALLPRRKLSSLSRFYGNLLPKLPLKDFINLFKKD